MTNDFAGVFGVRDPATALRALGVEPAWSDRDAAFGGAPVWTDRTGTIIASGEVVLDNADAIRRALDLDSDTAPGALLAELYRRHGTNAGLHALGMFAVALWDTRQRRLVLLRDGVGSRTIYHAQKNGAWYFAARLRTLRRCSAASNEIALPALRDYLTCAFVPGAQTLHRGIYELRPGTTLTIPDNETRTYWEPREHITDPDAPIATHAAELRALLEDAVRVRLPAESGTPVGVFLSGGVDSSLVAALAARHAPGPVHTFALHFGAPHANELSFSDLVARHCGTRHHVLEFPGKVIERALVESIAALDDPIGDPLTTPNYLLGRAASDETKIILNGEGGDPCFGGPKNVPMLLHELYGQNESREAAYLRSYSKCYDDLPRLLTPEARATLKDAPTPESLLTPFFDNPEMPDYLNRLLHINVRLKGADHILTKVNNLTAANGLLGRSPLFDRRIVEASFAIPSEYKLAGAVEKAVLKQAVADLLPAEIIHRPKSGMLVPVQHWFQKDLKRFARAHLLDRRARLCPYINREVVREWLDYRGNLWPRHGVKLWLLLTLEIWLRINE